MAAYNGPIVDVDVHHRPEDWTDIATYLPSEWRDYLAVNPPGDGSLNVLNENLSRRADTFPESGAPGSSYELTRAQLLDPGKYYRCVLTHDVGGFPAHANQYFMRAVCRAANDWNVDTWLSVGDDRLHSVIVVPTALPDECATEIKRMDVHPRMDSVLFSANPLGRPLGDPVHHGIFEAAAERGFPILVHAGNDRPNSSLKFVGGRATSLITYASQFTQQAHHYISSLIVHGAFEKYRDLRVVITEYGIAWLPWLMWALDDQYDRLREESAWVRKWPSEYIREHIRLSTQPLEDGTKATDLASLLQMVDGIEDMLCFSTDYPHSTMDDPSYAARVFPKSWHEKIFLRNACELYGWDIPASHTPEAVPQSV